MRLSANPNPCPWSWSLFLSIVYFVVVLHRGLYMRPWFIFQRHVNIKMDKRWDPKVYPWLWESMSLLLQNVHVDVWSCMEDVVLHKLLWHIFLENNICRLEIVVSLGHIEVQEFEQVISRNKSFLLKRNKSSLNTTNVFGCREENILFVNDQPSSRVFKVVANKKNI